MADNPLKFSVPYMRHLTKKLHEARLITSCMTCQHFSDLGDRCKLVDQTPPSNVIAYGCDSWDDGLNDFRPED